MHRDHKLGLALGVLIVGFAAALCFPKPADIDQRLLQLDSTAELDADIAQLPVHAYTDADPTPAPEPPPPTAEVIEPAEILPGGDGGSELLAGPPEPIPTELVATEPAGDAAQAVPLPEARISAPMQQYTVRPGDTLSSIAAHLLGNHSRYIELFEANREILPTPDDLQVGMVLNVPGTVAAAALKLPGDAAQSREIVVEEVVEEPVAVPESGTPADSSADRARRFRPARSPLIPAQPVSQTNATGLPAMDASDRSSAPAVEPETRTYTVRRGDTLEQIAVKSYGDARAVRDILDANREAVSDPRRLRPGMTLVLPPR
ncbi:MAG: LysM peptidoglycan-binding domain-containing protein [Planctomycetaceae bacterium]|nr:LysM peptidoglycan-binding domain-containing protein [Planctomycetaceae bacterium]